jgi:SAM-dependent methyltransferase
LSESPATFASSSQAYTRQRQTHWDEVARAFGGRHSPGQFYHHRLAEIYAFLIAPGARVLEVGCANGDLLASLRPAYGVGIDFSGEMVAQARQRHPELTILEADAHQLDLSETFDFIILSDLVNDLWDVQATLEQVARLSKPHTRVILNFHSRVWEPVLSLAQVLGLARPMLLQNWLTAADVNNLLYLSGFETLRTWREILWPLPLGGLFNRFLAKLWPFSLLDLTNFVLARPRFTPVPPPRPVVSVIVPARNEEGNIPAIFERIPEMGGGTEIVFVEGHSTDHTYDAIVQYAAAHPEKRCKIFKQDGRGKGDAVRKGFAAASGEVLMILDADLTVPPEDLPRFYEALVTNKGEMINGVRLVYPMEKEAMRFANLLGNKFFSLAFSWLMGQSLKDTLCGTKVMWKSDYELLAANRAYFGDFDPFGDYDLLFGAAHLNLKIIDLPIRYRERTYGTTNIQRWRHGLVLLRMTAFAALRLKFV